MGEGVGDETAGGDIVVFRLMVGDACAPGVASTDRANLVGTGGSVGAGGLIREQPENDSASARTARAYRVVRIQHLQWGVLFRARTIITPGGAPAKLAKWQCGK